MSSAPLSVRRPIRSLRQDSAERPYIVIWEVTRACGLVCQHCRADAVHDRHPRELDTAEGFALLDDIATFGSPRPVVVLTGVFVLGWSAPSLARQTPTFTRDVAPILYKNCSQCHRPNEVAPMPLMTYDEVRPWARSIKSKVLKKEMPPWGIGRSTLEFSNDRQMSEKDIVTLVSWVDGGAPKGNDADLPAPPAYPGGWKFNREPDVVLKMPVEFKIEPRSEYPMLDFYVPIPWRDGMKLIQMSEARPSNKAVVHHITVSLVTFPPGTDVIDGQPFTTDASGKKVPLDRRTARLAQIVDVHPISFGMQPNALQVEFHIVHGKTCLGDDRLVTRFPHLRKRHLLRRWPAIMVCQQGRDGGRATAEIIALAHDGPEGNIGP